MKKKIPGGGGVDFFLEKHLFYHFIFSFGVLCDTATRMGAYGFVDPQCITQWNNGTVPIHTRDGETVTDIKTTLGNLFIDDLSLDGDDIVISHCHRLPN